MNASIMVVTEKLKQEIDYITLTNPVDAWPPKVLDSKEFTFGPTKIQTGSMSQLVTTARGLLSGKGSVTWSFTIPEDYKYALIKFEGINHDAENCEEMGDKVTFVMGPNLPDEPASLQKFEIYPGNTAGGGVAERDASGNIVKDV